MLRLLKYLVTKNVASPVYLIHFLTGRCNASCAHCLLAGDKNKPQDEELSIDEIEKITNSFSRDIHNLNITGGEPFLRPDLAEIVKLYRVNARVRSFLLASNGFFAEKIIKAVETILNDNRDISLVLSLSLDHIGDKHDRLRGVEGLYRNVTSLYRKINALNEKRVSVQINLTLQKGNYRDSESILKHLVFGEGLKNINVTLVRGNSVNKFSPEIDYESYFKINRLINGYSASGDLKGFENNYLALLNAKNQISRRIIEKTVKNKKFISRCFAGSLSGVISPSGDVYPCELYKDKIGNLRDFGYDFKSLWSSERASRVREKISRDKCFCTHECNWTTNILFNLKYTPELTFRYFVNRLTQKN